MSEYISVEGLGNDVTGVITYWRLSGEASVAEYRERFESVGLDLTMLPPPPSHRTCLQRAVREIETKTLFARALEDEIGWALVVQSAGGPDGVPHYAVQAKVTLADGDQLMPAAVAYTADGERVVQDIMGRYRRLLGVLTTADVSAWLTRTIPTLDATALRDTGGVYFVPPAQIETLKKLAVVIGGGANKLHQIPALRSEDAVEAILGAIEREAENEAAGIETELADGKLGARALRTRTTRCNDILAKVKRYETLLGKQLTTITARVEQLEAQVVVATLAAESKEEKQ